MSHIRRWVGTAIMGVGGCLAVTACSGDDAAVSPMADASVHSNAVDAAMDAQFVQDAAQDAGRETDASAPDSAVPAAPNGVHLQTSALARVARPSNANVQTLGRDNRAFAFAMFHQLTANGQAGNLVFSPYSLSTALAMTYAGARGQTASEMQSTLHFSLDPMLLDEAFNATDLTLQQVDTGALGADGTPFKLNVNNSLWLQQGFSVLPTFLDVLAADYGSGVFSVDFTTGDTARDAINAWVAQKTNQLIPMLFDSIDPATKFVLTNTVYFNASWRSPFEPVYTQPAMFTRLDGSQVSAAMMSDDKTLPYAEDASWQAVELPYASDGLSFVAILPAAGKYAELEAQIDGDWFDSLLTKLTNQSVQIGLPKLDNESSLALAPPLQALGMTTAFSDAADFSGISEQSVKLDKVIQQAVIKVFEGGTIAAAATGVTVVAVGAQLPDKTVIFSRPFVYAVYDSRTGSLLFVGRVLDPTAK